MPETLLAPWDAVAQLIESGGPVVVWILASFVVMWTLVFERYWFFSRRLPQMSESLLQQWLARDDHQSWKARQIRRAMISRLNAAMSANIQVLRVLVPLAPLLGLLGTVIGMLNIFDSMAARGSVDARAMADGVSEAMVCTMTGLAVSMSGLLPVNRFKARIRQQTELLADRFTY